MSRRPPGLAVLAVLLIGCGSSHDASDSGPADATYADSGADGGSLDAAPLDGGAALDGDLPSCPAGCDDGVDCTMDDCIDGTCTHDPRDSSCPADESCDPTVGCMPTVVCSDDSDCEAALDDPCVVAATCDPARRVCAYARLDGDGDGHPPIVCGGDDCDDGDDSIHPEAVEACDGRDEDCDGVPDSPLPGDACPSDRSCSAGACVCAPGHEACDGATCVDLASDPVYCGSCDVTCRATEICVAGSCRCPGSLEYCAGECRDTTTDTAHCGACFAGCPDGASCAASTCECPVGETACFGACTDTSSNPLSCGGCSVQCLAEAECTAGSCHPALTWVDSWDTNTDSWPGYVYERVAAGASGDVAIAGQARGTLRDGAGGFILTSSSRRAFVLRLDSGGAVSWGREYPSTGTSSVHDVAIDPLGGVIFCGQFSGGLPLGSATYTASGGPDGLLARLDSAGNLVWSKHLGSSVTGVGDAAAMAVDTSGNMAVTGTVPGDFDFGGGVRTAVDVGGYVARFDLDGAHLASWRVPGEPSHVALDASGDVWIAGTFTGTVDFGSGPVTADHTDIFVSRYSPSGGSPATFTLTSPNVDRVYGLAAVSGGAVLSSTTYLVAGYGASGALSWGIPRVIDSATLADPRDLALTPTGNLVVVGGFRGAFDFGAGPGRSGDGEGFVATYDPTGALIDVGQTRYGCARPDCAYVRGLSVSPGGSIFVAGYFKGSMYFGSERLDSLSGWDSVFAARLEP